MEASALNQAHLQHRRAEVHLKHRRFSEAIECHRKSAELLSEALNYTQNLKAIESLKLQRDFHIRQTNVILIKKEQFENYKKALENRRRPSNFSNNDFEDAHENESTTLQVAIYRNMEEADSLLGMLMKRGSSGNSDSESLRSFSTTDTDEKLGPLDTLDNGIIGNKHPKDESVVIEELRTLNEQLHTLVFKLVTQLDASKREVDCLREKVKQLESDKYKVYNKNTSNNLKVITDSSGGTSPFVFSPCSELSPDVNESRALPPLAPLEMPNFDFTSLIKSSSHINAGN
ncbi:hypothetical protein AMK59_5096 [Oryctes borbonicus]|uniref:Nuclear receptor-binding factor 2 MIT domain-containing protein n=1 Tax=Oryctes borbonicus TaxID=1629725 RepID=A0A0T6AZY0_9SCAR|nr:hypothetical protein AMK59_5096 [Oryctes borbonicus]